MNRNQDGAIIDLTYPIHQGMTTFPVHWHPFVEVTQLGRIGIEGRESRKLVLGTHSGTHVDAPRHFIPDGETIDRIPLETLVGPAKLIDFSDAAPLAEIQVEDFELQLGDECPERLVMRFDWSTQWGSLKYYTEHPYISEGAANWLKARGVRLLGMDTPQADSPKNGRGSERDSPIHKILLGAGIIKVEYLTNLKLVTSMDFELIVLPLPIRDGDGAPARCIARL